MHENGGDTLEKVMQLFLENKLKQLALKSQHERDERFGVAYLALWNVLESFAKDVAPLCQRVELRMQLEDWIYFLRGDKKEKPKNITAEKFNINKVKYEKIPTASLLKILIKSSDGENFFEIIDPNKKYRKRRNNIAHSGEEPSKDVYDEFNCKALRAIDEVEAWLSVRNSKIS